MNARRTCHALALLLLGPALAALAADKDNYGDPLPEGAKARVGTARLRVVPYSSPALTADGKALYAQTNTGLARIDPATGAVQGKVPAQFFGVPNALSDDGKRALFVSFDRVTVWDTETGQLWYGVFALAALAVGGVFLRGCRDDAEQNRPPMKEIMQKARDNGR